MSVRRPSLANERKLSLVFLIVEAFCVKVEVQEDV